MSFDVYKIKKESLIHFSQFTSVKVKKNLRKSQVQFREKLRKLRLRQIDGFLIKETCSIVKNSIVGNSLLKERPPTLLGFKKFSVDNP